MVPDPIDDCFCVIGGKITSISPFTPVELYADAVTGMKGVCEAFQFCLESVNPGFDF